MEAGEYRHDQLALMVTTVGLPLVLVVPISENSVFLLHLKPVGCAKLALWTPPHVRSSSCMVSIFSVISWSSNFSKEVFPDCCKLECWLLRQFWSMIFLLRARKSPKTCWFSAFELRDLTSSNDSSIARPLSITRFSWLICMKSRDRLGFLLDTIVWYSRSLRTSAEKRSYSPCLLGFNTCHWWV